MLALLLSACFLSPEPMTGEEYIEVYTEAQCAVCWEESGYEDESMCVEELTEQYRDGIGNVGAACPDEDDLDDCLDAIEEADCYDFAHGVDGDDCFPSVLLHEGFCEDEDDGG